MSLKPQELQSLRNVEHFKDRVDAALRLARSGQVAIVIVPHMGHVAPVLAYLGQQLDSRVDTNARCTPDALHFQGHNGSVRVYPCTHATWSPTQKRLLDYPAGVVHFLHPEVDV